MLDPESIVTERRDDPFSEARLRAWPRRVRRDNAHVAVWLLPVYPWAFAGGG